ncbi:hypothetical protein E2C01_071376 [Portunus trituberculatus]|uniref:Uncharacterized protein n=1 Tax=Portunus trituberculatus TaxID=210409 RepID=A0A5B7I4Y6_PORTR|nr:hypothetical protein [Portunus trituberculatus]
MQIPLASSRPSCTHTHRRGVGAGDPLGNCPAYLCVRSSS